jgi:hypothetical protein
MGKGFSIRQTTNLQTNQIMENYKRDGFRYVWDSPDAFLESVLAVTHNTPSHSPEWTGESRKDMMQRTREGNLALIPQAEALLSQIEADIDADGPLWQGSVAGSFPDVPAFLSGDPECMRARVVCPNEKAPVRVFVCTTSSCGVEASTLLKRGIAALALVMQLIKQGRPIELWTFTKLDGNREHEGTTCLLVRMPTAPVDMARIAHCLSACSFDRTLAMGFGYARTGFTGGWARQKDSRKLVNAGPKDIVLNESKYDDEIVKRPLDWIKQQLAMLSED